MNSAKQTNTFFDFLQHPFPEAESMKEYAKTLSIIALFVTLFLGMIRPFNMHQVENKVWVYSVIFGVITFLAGMTYELIIRYILKIKKEGEHYTLLKWILLMIGLLLYISLFNYLYLRFEFGMPLDDFITMIWATFLVGIFPTVFLGTIAMLKREKTNAKIAENINKKNLSDHPKVLDRKLFDIPTDQIWYIESLQNYVNIYFNSLDIIDKKTERATLKSCAEQLENTKIIQCHRSYMVNTSKIENVTGNAQGLKLKLINIPNPIPVSRSYIAQFKD